MNKTLSRDELDRLSTTIMFSRAERLSRWADVIEKHPHAIYPIWRYEDLSPQEKRMVEITNSPLGIAFDDPILKDAGLTDQTVGGAKNFFEISDKDMHEIVCSCMGSTHPRDVAARIRNVAGRKTGILDKIVSVF